MKIGKINRSYEFACTKDDCENTGKIVYREEEGGNYHVIGKFSISRISGELDDPRLVVEGYEISVIVDALKPECIRGTTFKSEDIENCGLEFT